MEKAPHINITNFCYDKNLNIQDDLHFSFELNSDEIIGKIRVEYVIFYLKSNGTYTKKEFYDKPKWDKIQIKNLSKTEF